MSCLDTYEFPGDDTPIVIGSALKALEGDPEYVEKIIELGEVLDTYIPSQSVLLTVHSYACRRCVLNLWSWYGCDGSY